MGKTRLLSTTIAWLVTTWWGAAGWSQMRPHIVPEGPLSPAEQSARFHVPPGFEIELVASEPEIRNPLSINFDNRGRLWVTDTIEYPLPPKGPGRDALKVFEDSDGDGVIDRRRVLYAVGARVLLPKAVPTTIAALGQWLTTPGWRIMPCGPGKRPGSLTGRLPINSTRTAGLEKGKCKCDVVD